MLSIMADAMFTATRSNIETEWQRQAQRKADLRYLEQTKRKADRRMLDRAFYYRGW